MQNEHRRLLIVFMSDVHRFSDKLLPVSIAPGDTNLEVGVMDKRGDVVALVFPVHKKGTYWVDANEEAYRHCADALASMAR